MIDHVQTIDILFRYIAYEPISKLRKTRKDRLRRSLILYFLVESESIKFWFSQTHRSYAKIIFLAGFAKQGGLNEGAAMA